MSDERNHGGEPARPGGQPGAPLPDGPDAPRHDEPDAPPPPGPGGQTWPGPGAPAPDGSGAPSGGSPGGESTFTVVVAAAANLGIALAKLVAGLISGSSAMLSEAAHSVADTVTEVMLLTALRRGARPADEEHPLGHGAERYIWAMLASVATFVGGSVFSLYDGIHTLVAGEELGDPLVSYLVLAVAFLLEGFSLRTGLRQVRGTARLLGMPAPRYLRRTPDTAVKAVVMEDSAALIGLLLAAGGLLGGQLTGSGAWDGVASVLIGLLLAYVAWVLGRSNAQLLIGRPLPAEVRAGVREELLSVPHIVDVLELTTLIQGPREMLVAAKIDFRDLASAEQVEWACEEAEAQLRERYPTIRRVYLDPTPGRVQRRRSAETGAD
ncbi:cation diffusion facilitator family transporter [Streptomyces nitrosporeus]|uniref:cation diffusion facilitator family transporter n=1 Tax=Streptomyces nitrosporeus TaxID=28894 RepID=UPI003320F62A